MTAGDPFEEMLERADLDGPWVSMSGMEKPPAIDPGGCPSGLVFVACDWLDQEMKRWEGLTLSDAELAGVAGAAWCEQHPGHTIVVYDGDSGAPVVRLGVE